MEQTTLDQFKLLRDEIRKNLQQLKQNAEELGLSIGRDFLVSEDVAEQLERSLSTYRERIRLLRLIGRELSIGVRNTLSELDEDIRVAEERHLIVSMKSKVLDYFRLVSSDKEDRALSESKLILIERCREADQRSTEALKPFFTVVDKVRDESSVLTDDEGEEITSGISYSLARKVDHKLLRIDPLYPINQYLDGSCDLLTEDVPAYSQADNPDSNKKQSKAEALPEQKQDIIAKVSFKDVSAGSLGASKFINMVRQKPMTALAVFFVGHHILLEETDLSDEPNHYYAPADDIRKHLTKQGYLMEITLETASETRRFLTLSSKGWECFSKKETSKFLSSQKPSLMIPASIRMRTSDLTDMNVLRLAMLHDYFSNRKVRLNYTVLPFQKVRFPIAQIISDKDDMVRVVAAVFAPLEELECFNVLQHIIDNLASKEALHIIVMSEANIDKINSKLKIPSDSKRVLYCLYGEPEQLFTHDGVPIIE